ncbi:hypothetical protein ACFE04_005278 [Oxalis oulophora]
MEAPGKLKGRVVQIVARSKTFHTRVDGRRLASEYEGGGSGLMLKDNFHEEIKYLFDNTSHKRWNNYDECVEHLVSEKRENMAEYTSKRRNNLQHSDAYMLHFGLHGKCITSKHNMEAIVIREELSWVVNTFDRDEIINSDCKEVVTAINTTQDDDSEFGMVVGECHLLLAERDNIFI